MTMLGFLTFFTYFTFSRGSYHWIVTETGRIEQKLDGAFPIRRSYDLPAILDQEQRVSGLAEMHKTMQQLKDSVDDQWTAIESENGFEEKMFTTDKHCSYLDDRKMSYEFVKPIFIDFPRRDRPRLCDDRVHELPPDCRKYHKLDFSLLTFPHLKSLRDVGWNVSKTVGDLEGLTQLDVDLRAMLAVNRTDWTSYNLAVRYWQMRGNGTNAIECARRAIFFAPNRYRHIPIFNLGSLLHAMESYGEAAIVLHTAVDLDRGYFRSHVALGHVYLYLGDYARSVGCYENALSLRPDLTALAKLRSSVMCYQQVIAGLRAIDTALKKMVDDLQKYTKLQEQWVWMNTQIGVERTYGVINTPSLENLRLLWKKVEKQTSSLAERMTQAQTILEEGSGRPAKVRPRHTEDDSLLGIPKDHHPNVDEYLEASENPEKDPEKEEEKVQRRKVAEFYKFMNFMSYERTLSEEQLKIAIIEKLVALQNDFEGDLSSNSEYWNIVRKCRNRDDDDILLFECGYKIFGDYVQLVNPTDSADFHVPNIIDFDDDFDDEPLELLDESIIENYVGDKGNRDSSEL